MGELILQDIFNTEIQYTIYINSLMFLVLFFC